MSKRQRLEGRPPPPPAGDLPHGGEEPPADQLPVFVEARTHLHAISSSSCFRLRHGGEQPSAGLPPDLETKSSSGSQGKRSRRPLEMNVADMA